VKQCSYIYDSINYEGVPIIQKNVVLEDIVHDTGEISIQEIFFVNSRSRVIRNSC